MYDFVFIGNGDGFHNCIREQGTVKTLNFNGKSSSERNKIIARYINYGYIDKFGITFNGRSVMPSTIPDDVVSRWLHSEKNLSNVYEARYIKEYYERLGELPKSYLNLRAISGVEQTRLGPHDDGSLQDVMFIYEHKRYKDEFDSDRVYFKTLGKRQYIYLKEEGNMFIVADRSLFVVNVIENQGFKYLKKPTNMYETDGRYLFERMDVGFPYPITDLDLREKSKKCLHIGSLDTDSVRSYIRRLSLLE